MKAVLSISNFGVDFGRRGKVGLKCQFAPTCERIHADLRPLVQVGIILSSNFGLSRDSASVCDINEGIGR